MNNQQNPTQAPVEEKRLCRKCGQRLPSKTGFCMYCGTDNSNTSVQHSQEMQNNEQLKKYRVIEAKKQKPLWYLIFMLILIDIIVINVIMAFNSSDMFIKVNTARFNDYEESFYIADGAYLGIRNQKAKVIGINRSDYQDITSVIQNYTIKDAKVVTGVLSLEKIYLLTTDKKMITIFRSLVEETELKEDYKDVYDYLNRQKRNCVSDKEFIVLKENAFYFDPDAKSIFSVTGGDMSNENNTYCFSFERTRTLTEDELNMKNPSLVYQSEDGGKIILRDDDELVTIEGGRIRERVTEISVGEKKIKVEKIKKIFYQPDFGGFTNYLIIDNKNEIYNTNTSNITDITSSEVTIDVIPELFKLMDKDTKINLIIIGIALIVNLVILYKMSDQHTFSKCISTAGIIFVELILFILIRGGGIQINSADAFFALLETLFLLFLALLIVSMVIIQVAELVVGLLDIINFRNIFSYILVFIAILSIFLVINSCGKYGLFFSIFALGSFWAYFTEKEDIDIDLFIMPNTRTTIIILAVLNVLLYFVFLNIFHICDYFIFLLLIAIMYAIYLTARPTLSKKELSGKIVKSLLVMIMYIVYTFISTIFSMNLFTTLKDDHQGLIMKEVLKLELTNIIYLAVTFIFLSIISIIFRMIHKIIKASNKKTNSVVIFLIFSIVALTAFTAVIYFFPEIMNLINTAVQEIMSNFGKE